MNPLFSSSHSQNTPASTAQTCSADKLSWFALVLASVSLACSASPSVQIKEQNQVNGNDASDKKSSYLQTLSSVRDPGDIDRWAVINDGVMGGRSQSTLEALPAGAIFAGAVSAENGGGFASVRASLSNPTAPDGRAISVRVRGDGKTYQFRIRTDTRWDGPAYKYTFTTEPGEWQEIVMPLREFQASFRGRLVADAPAIESGAIQQVGFLIADKQLGPFKLEFDDIKLI